jgi:hypothetical protein
MAKLVELDLGDGKSVLVEANDDVSVPRGAIPGVPYARVARDGAAAARFDRVSETLRGFADRAVQALKDVDADVERVTLQFGIGLGGDAGVPFVTMGSADSALSVTIQCNLARRNERSMTETDD